MVADGKEKIFAKLDAALAKLDAAKFPRELSVLDHVLLAVLQENAAPSQAVEAYRRLVAGFHDFNELRVSHSRELEELLGDLPEANVKARRVTAVLQFVFETTYNFDLESMKSKPLKQAMRQLSKIIGITPFVVSATVQRALGGHTIPLDERIMELLKQLDLLEPGDSPEEAQATLERWVPKSKALRFATALAELAADDDERDNVVERIHPTGRNAKPRRPAVVKKSPISAVAAARSPSKNGVAHKKSSKK